MTKEGRRREGKQMDIAMAAEAAAVAASGGQEGSPASDGRR